jgi:methionyl-tRNA formyltransferase
MFKKIVFMGTPNFSVPILKSLYQNGYPICAVYTQPPKKSMRGQKTNKSPIQKLAENIDLNVRNPNLLNQNKEELKYFKSLSADIVIVVAYGQLIPKEFLSLSKNGFINIHASLLPKWRGAAPIQRAIMNLDEVTGISVMRINEKLDAGPTMFKKEIKLGNEMNAEDVIKIIAKINGLYPNPGAWFLFQGERYKILKATLSDLEGQPGSVLDDNLTVACGTKSIKIQEIQRQGKSKQKATEFLLGSKIKKSLALT